MRISIVAILMGVVVCQSVTQQKKGIESVGKTNPEHGRYIAENVAMCVQCHTPREADGTLIRSRLFDGAPIPAGKPIQLHVWAEYAPRIAGLPQYSEEQMIKLLTTGIGKEGKPLRSPMPTFKLSLQDARDVVAYLQLVQ